MADIPAAPVLELAGAQIRVGPHPANPALKVILIGPIVLALPLESETASIVVQGLTGGVVVPQVVLPDGLGSTGI